MAGTAALDYATIVDREGRALAAAARRDPSAEVPATPGWDVSKLVRHLAFVHARVTAGLQADDQESFFRRDDSLPSPAKEQILETYDEGLTALLSALGTGAADRPTWTLDPTVGRASFWPRRMAHETMIHRVDVEQAVGAEVTPIAPEEAVDGIDELLSTFTVPRTAATAAGTGETVHLHATDADGEWLLTLGADGVAVEHGHAKGDLAVRGPAADLELWLWGRGPIDGLELFGDQALADRLRELVKA
ncbi:MAG: maleylpyruvate isomerase family mycothiol-dependent enzyme [Acidobacteria bacterium]|nr:maleylpyruvate isomerase family mycothiol-dependent enzyme [Acidobacteriota bacterium]